MSVLGSFLGPNTIAGAASITINGIPYNLVGELAYQANVFKAEVLEGQDGVHGRSVMPQSPYIKAKLRDAVGMTVGAFMLMDGVTVTCILASGKSVSGDNMFCLECEEVDTEKAEFEVKFGTRGQIIEG